MPLSKDAILDELKLFSLNTGILGNWLTNQANDMVFRCLSGIEENPLMWVHLNQLLSLGYLQDITEDFFTYYWLSCPENHPYKVDGIPGFSKKWPKESAIVSLEHFKWGLYRLFMDGLLYFGNIDTAFKHLHSMTQEGLEGFFASKQLPLEHFVNRGPALPMNKIPRDDRFLIAEQACKSYGADIRKPSDLKTALLKAYQKHQSRGGGKITFMQLLKDDIVDPNRQAEFLFSVEDILEESIGSVEELEDKFQPMADRFFTARSLALANTEYYLSMVNDLDVYVATSMRVRQDFRDIAGFCNTVFSNSQLDHLHLRHFDPTLSAANCHEDKGIIECLMVKCAKVLVYYAGEKDSYGKVAEAAMALSLGKPVIFYCDREPRKRIYQDIHPLTRLINFKTGVAVGAIVTASLEDVPILLSRIFENKMEYELQHDIENRRGYIKVVERLTKSVVRLQTNDSLLTRTFWNQYHRHGIAST